MKNKYLDSFFMIVNKNKVIEIKIHINKINIQHHPTKGKPKTLFLVPEI